MPVLSLPQYFAEAGYAPNPPQREFHYTPSRFKVFKAGRRVGKTLAGGMAPMPYMHCPCPMTGEGVIGWIIGPQYCLSEDTEVLTRRGWLTCDQVKPGDALLTYNATTGHAEWQDATHVSVFDGPVDVMRMKTRGHESLSTLDHRWVLDYHTQNTSDGKKRRIGSRILRSYEIGKKSNEYVPCGAPVDNLPDAATWSDDVVELVAWYYTEGNCSRDGSGGLKIAQCRVANPEKWQRIHDRLSSLLPSGWSASDRGFYIFAAHAELLIQHAPGFAKIPTADFVTSLTRSQLELFIDASILADGHGRVRSARVGRPAATRERTFVQNNMDRLDMFQMACQLAGYRTTRTLHSAAAGTYAVRVFERSSFAPKFASRTIERYEGRVWCPTTPNGTWLARSNGATYFTGNTHAEKEFRVIYDTWRRMGVDKDCIKFKKNADAGDMHIVTSWGAEVIGKSAAHPETLVGEGLNFAMLVEGGLHKRRTWAQYIRPALSDRRGWAVISGVPEGKSETSLLYALDQRGVSTRPEDASWRSFRAPSWANTVVFPGGRQDPEILEAESDLTKAEFDRQYGAEFVDGVGAVFQDFDGDLHVGDFDFDRSWETFMAVDEGWTEPFRVLFIQRGPFGDLRVIREYEYLQHDAPDVARSLLADPVASALTRACKTMYGDPAEPGDNATLSRMLRIPQNKNTGGELKIRRQLIERFLKIRPHLRRLPDGHPEKLPGIMFDRKHCPKLIWEMQTGYKWPEKRADVPLSDKDNPVDKDNHSVEALGRFMRGMYVNVGALTGERRPTTHQGVYDRDGSLESKRGPRSVGPRR